MNTLLCLTLISILIPQLLIHNVAGKECSNTPPGPANTDQHKLFGASLNWEAMYKNIKYGNTNDSKGFLKDVSLHDVRLHPDSFFGTGQQTNMEYLLWLDVDNLVWSFRKTAGLPTPGKPYGGWEAFDGELRGHFVGHYLSATALMWASSHNSTLYDKMNKLIAALDECQREMGTGYLSAFPNEFFDRVEAMQQVWAPYYTMHKIMSGLLDQHTYAGSTQALKMVVWMGNYFANRVQNLIEQYSIERHYASLNTESGGMNDVYYRLYMKTGNHKFLVLGTLFDKPCFIGGLALQTDVLSGFHVNTHLPLVIGTNIRYELTSDPLYKAIGEYFMNTVNSSHSYATGGTSVNEHWSDPSRLADTLQKENEESCTTYNMLKVSRQLFRWTKGIQYADYYERALTNGVLSIQRGREPGIMIYMLPLGPGESKARSQHGWGTNNESFWCCYGTGTESFAKLGDSIYFEGGEREGLYIIQYISNTFNWRSRGIVINQNAQSVVSSDPTFRVTFNFTADMKSKKWTMLNFRIPRWADTNGALATLNGVKSTPPSPGSFMSIYRKWRTGDTLSLQWPMKMYTEAIQDDRPEFSNLKAILYGPYVLAGMTNGDWDLKIAENAPLSNQLTPVRPLENSQLITLYQQSSQGTTFVVSSVNNTLTMAVEPKSGTNSAAQATFRAVYKGMNSSDSSHAEQINFVDKEIMLEPFSLPGMAVVQLQRGHNVELGVANAQGTTESSKFRIVKGLDKNETVSLESASRKGCFLYSKVNYNDTTLSVKCQSGSQDADFKHATSFKLGKGLSEYHPISFVATGLRRNFLLMPLFGYRDESYTVYFKMNA